eukprot:Skav233956  [mRNA]  locus=scaffold1382:260846:268157:+ [translate_table: standard]
MEPAQCDELCYVDADAERAQQEELQRALDAARAEAKRMGEKVQELEDELDELKELRSWELTGTFEEESQARHAAEANGGSLLSSKCKEKESLFFFVSFLISSPFFSFVSLILSSLKPFAQASQGRVAIQDAELALKAVFSTELGDFASLTRLEQALIEAPATPRYRAAFEEEKASMKSEFNELKASAALGCTGCAHGTGCEALAQKLAVAEAVLRSENQEIRETLAKISMSEKRLSSTVAELNGRLSTSVPSNFVEASQELREHQELQEPSLRESDAAHEKCLKSLDDLQGERGETQERLRGDPGDTQVVQ